MDDHMRSEHRWKLVQSREAGRAPVKTQSRNWSVAGYRMRQLAPLEQPTLSLEFERASHLQDYEIYECHEHLIKPTLLRGLWWLRSLVGAVDNTIEDGRILT